MKALRQLCAAFVLTLALALSAFAGEIQTGKSATSPQSSTKQGEIQTTRTGQIDTMRIGTATEIALKLLQGVLSLI
jgi:hypothetical protein